MLVQSRYVNLFKKKESLNDRFQGANDTLFHC